MIRYPASRLPFRPSDHTVLLASSDGKMLERINAVLQEAGFNTVTCRDSLSLLARITETVPTLLVIDSKIEPLDVVETIGRLYAVPQLYRFPFLCLTHRAGEWPMWATTREIYGAVCFLTVPFQDEEFLYLVCRGCYGIKNGDIPTEERDFPFPATRPQ